MVNYTTIHLSDPVWVRINPLTLGPDLLRWQDHRGVLSASKLEQAVLWFMLIFGGNLKCARIEWYFLLAWNIGILGERLAIALHSLRGDWLYKTLSFYNYSNTTLNHLLSLLHQWLILQR